MYQLPKCHHMSESEILDEMGWTRDQFENWAAKVAGQYGYEVSFASVGTEVDNDGGPTQMAVFKR